MTQRAFLVGFIGLCIYIIVLFNDLPAFSILTWLSITLLVSSGGVALLSLQGLRCRWNVGQSVATESFAPRFSTQASGEIEAGDDASLEVELGNFGTLNKAGLLLDVSLQRIGGAISTRRYLIEALPANSTIAFPLPLRHLARGCYRVEEVRIVGSDVLGLFRATLRIREPGEPRKIPWWRFGRAKPDGTRREPAPRFLLNRLTSRARSLVSWLATSYPSFAGIAFLGVGLRDLRAGKGLYMVLPSGVLALICFALNASRKASRRRATANAPRGEEIVAVERRILVGPATVSAASSARRARREGEGGGDFAVRLPVRGEEIRGTRPYVAGDDLRTVHWKSTARLGRLVVKEFQPEVQSQSLVIWDGAEVSLAMLEAAMLEATMLEAAPQAASSRSASSRSASSRGRVVSRNRIASNDAAKKEAAFALESGLRFTASLCRALGESGQACALWRLDAAPRRASSGDASNNRWASPSTFGGSPTGLATLDNIDSGAQASRDSTDVSTSSATADGGHFSGAPFAIRCAELLADARPERTGALAQAMSTHVREMARGGAAYLVTPSLSPDVRASVATLQRQGFHVTVAFWLQQPAATPQDALQDALVANRNEQGVVAEDAAQIGQALEEGLAGARVVFLSRVRGKEDSGGAGRGGAGRDGADQLRESLEEVRSALDETMGGASSPDNREAAGAEAAGASDNEPAFAATTFRNRGVGV